MGNFAASVLELGVAVTLATLLPRLVLPALRWPSRTLRAPPAVAGRLKCDIPHAEKAPRDPWIRRVVASRTAGATGAASTGGAVLQQRAASIRFAFGGLFGRLLAVMCAVAAASTGLVLVLQERSLSADLERAAEQRLDNAAHAAARLVEGRLVAMAERYRVVAGTPQFRATLEIDDAPTLTHFAGSLLARHDAARIAFVGKNGRVAAGAGDPSLDGPALAVREHAVVALGDHAYAVASTPLGAAGRLVAVEALGAETLADWSELCGAEVVLVPPDHRDPEGIGRTVLSLGALELRVTSSLEAERAAMVNARVNLAVAVALGLALAFGLSFVVSRNLVQPIHEVRAAAQRVGAGDLSSSIESDRADEIGDVARAFEEMSRELRDTIQRASEAADRVEETASAIGRGTQRFLAVSQEQQRGNEQAAATLAEIGEVVERIEISASETGHTLDLAVDGSSASFRELAESGEALRANASRLSGETDEIARALAQVAESALQVADDTEALLSAANTASHSVGDVASAAASLHATAEETARLSDEMTATAERGRGVVRDAVEGMEATRQTIEQSEQVILSLRGRAEEIGAILTVIDDVAEETSLLSLNAAIIAAQAGESGKPFAVVADAMKAMWQRVQASTKEIDGVVRAVQSESAHAVESIALGTTRAREGLRLIQQAESSLLEITGAARQTGEHMAHSTSSTARQTAAAEAVVEQMQAVHAGVNRIRAVTRAQVETNDAVQRRSDDLRSVARQMQASVEVQTRGSQHIGESVEAVQTAVRGITEGLKQQGAASQGVAEVVRRSMEYTRTHESTAAEIGEAAEALARQAQALREAVRRFRV